MSCYYQMFVTEINRIYIHHINMIYFFMVLVWFLFQVVDGSISSASADLFEVVHLYALCALLVIDQASSDQIVWTTISSTPVHGHSGTCLCFFLLLSFLLLLFLFCWNLLFHLDCWLSQIELFGLQLLLPRLILAHSLHLNLPKFWWVLYLFSLAYHCHLAHV